MIQINKTQATAYVLSLVEDALINAHERDFSINIEDVDDLYDLTIESQDICQIDRVHDALYSMLPIVSDEVMGYIDDALDYDDCWGTMAMRESIGFCDF